MAIINVVWTEIANKQTKKQLPFSMDDGFDDFDHPQSIYISGYNNNKQTESKPMKKFIGNIQADIQLFIVCVCIWVIDFFENL